MSRKRQFCCLLSSHSSHSALRCNTLPAEILRLRYGHQARRGRASQELLPWRVIVSDHPFVGIPAHMNQFRLAVTQGKDAVSFLEKLVVGDIKSIENGSGSLSVFTNEKGGIIDDTVVTKVHPPLLCMWLLRPQYLAFIVV